MKLNTVIFFSVLCLSTSILADDDDKCSELFNAGKYEQALPVCHTQAEKGKAMSQANLASMYNDGTGTGTDYAKALKWFSESAHQGNLNAQYNVGRMYSNGHGVPQDYKKAIYWFEKAAIKGHINSQVVLGQMHGMGQGVTRNRVTAYAWLDLAASQGNDGAASLRDLVTQLMTSAQIKTAQARSQEYQKKYSGNTKELLINSE